MEEKKSFFKAITDKEKELIELKNDLNLKEEKIRLLEFQLKKDMHSKLNEEGMIEIQHLRINFLKRLLSESKRKNFKVVENLSGYFL